MNMLLCPSQCSTGQSSDRYFFFLCHTFTSIVTKLLSYPNALCHITVLQCHYTPLLLLFCQCFAVQSQCFSFLLQCSINVHLPTSVSVLINPLLHCISQLSNHNICISYLVHFSLTMHLCTHHNCSLSYHNVKLVSTTVSTSTLMFYHNVSLPHHIFFCPITTLLCPLKISIFPITVYHCSIVFHHSAYLPCHDVLLSHQNVMFYQIAPVSCHIPVLITVLHCVITILCTDHNSPLYPS